MAISKDKKKKLDGIMAGINKTKGLIDSVHYVKDIKDQLTVKFYKTPSHEFNIMLNGGFGKGRVVEMYGPESSGKTTMAILTIKKNQDDDPDFIAGWFETEGSISQKDLENYGVDMDRIVYWDQTEVGAEKGFDILRSLVSSKEFNMIVVNSIAGLCPTVETEKSMEAFTIGVTARLMSKLFRVITGPASKTGCTLVFINQVREKIGVMFGNPETTPGGRALAFFSSQRLNMRKVKLEAKGEPITAEEGVKIHARVTKNRLASGNPYTTCDYYGIYGYGVDAIAEIPNVLERLGIITNNKGRFLGADEMGNARVVEGVELKWFGKGNFIADLKANEKLRLALEEEINNAMKSGKAKAASMSDEDIEKVKDEDEKVAEEFEQQVEA